jgi:hypothetical protein
MRMHRYIALAVLGSWLVISGCGGGDVEPGRPADASAPDADSGEHADGGAEDDAGRSEPTGICANCGGCEQALPVVSQFHVMEPIEYPEPPPVGGDHSACWFRWGAFAEPVPDERWVHNLEHGGVVFLYDCSDGCPAELAELKELAARSPRTILTPYAALPTRFGVVAWGHRLLSNCLDVAAYRAFYDAHFDRAPESISADPPSSCN